MKSRKVYYRFETATWEIVEDSSNEQIFLGFFKKQLTILDDVGPRMSFHLREKDAKVGPLIGILIGENELNSPIGNTGLIKALSIEAYKIGAILFAFTPQAVNQKKINGFLYHPKYGEWLKMVFPIPDTIYNRTPYRSEELNPDTLSTIDWLQSNQIPFFNQHFFDKKEVYQAFLVDPTLHKHIPKTTIFRDFEQLKKILYQTVHLYVKPSSSHKGKGIFTLKKTNNATFIYNSNEITTIFNKYNDLTDFLSKKMSLNNTYLLQQYIEKETVEGCPFDLRVLAHKFNNQWNVTGIGFRCAAPGNVTTHVPSGGKILEEDMLPIKIDHGLIKQMVTNCGEQLDANFGPVREFSLDIGIDTNGQYFIFEANSKPMKFDEPHIKSKVPVHLMKALLEQIHF